MICEASLNLHVSGWSWPLPCSGRGRYQSCLGFSQVSIFPISNIRVTFSAAGFLLFQLFCTSLTWICVLCNEYGHLFEFKVHQDGGDFHQAGSTPWHGGDSFSPRSCWTSGDGTIFWVAPLLQYQGLYFVSDEHVIQVSRYSIL